MEHLPVFIKLTDQPCLVVGGGSVGQRKVALLREAGAKVTVVSPVLSQALTKLHRQGQITHIVQHYATAVLAHPWRLVIAATNDEVVNARVSDDCEQCNLLVNVVDTPRKCRFIMPAIVERGPITIAVSSGGQSPVLTRLLKTKLEALIPQTYTRLAILAADYRQAVKARFAPETRRRFWENMLTGAWSQAVLSGQEQQAEAIMQSALQQTNIDFTQGSVHLVGVGSGKADWLTIAALQTMQSADVVLYDRLIPPEIMALVRRDAERIYVGKERKNHCVPQEDINAMMVRLAKAGQKVVRLKAGDPFVFGRGGEEMQAMQSAGVSVSIIPGITAALGCAASAGIPLTHRDHSQGLSLVTAHLKDGQLDLPWASLVAPRQTLAFYMGLSSLGELTDKLQRAGLPADYPIAVIEKGSHPDQRVLKSTLSEVVAKVERHAFQSPSLLIVGSVATLAQEQLTTLPHCSKGLNHVFHA
ncbi:MAG: siroheme synthase CysG [Proteobacteria bacterium]|nr:siroheme synthase CysG [Pseudomonadota bacterium]